MDALLAVGNDLREVYLVDVTQALAPRTSPLGRVERKGVGCGVAIGDARRRTHQSLGEVLDVSCLIVDNHDESLALLHGNLYALPQTLVLSRFPFTMNHQPVNDHLDVVGSVAVDLHALHQFLQLAVHADVYIAFAAHALEEFAVMTLAALYQWCQKQDLTTGIVVLYHVDDLLLGVLHHRFAGHIAVGLAGTGIEQTQIVVDFRRGAYGGAGVLVGGLLLDADDGRQSRNLVNVRTFHASEKVSCVGREGLDVAALSLGKDGVEGQRRLTRA